MLSPEEVDASRIDCRIVTQGVERDFVARGFILKIDRTARRTLTVADSTFFQSHRDEAGAGDVACDAQIAVVGIGRNVDGKAADAPDEEHRRQWAARVARHVDERATKRTADVDALVRCANRRVALIEGRVQDDVDRAGGALMENRERDRRPGGRSPQTLD